MLALGVFSIFNHQAQQRWDAYVTQVSQQPGIVVIHEGLQKGNTFFPSDLFSAGGFSAGGFSAGGFSPGISRRYFINGLRDPLATDPVELLKATSINPKDVQMHWEPYFSLLPELTRERIVTLLNPPATVSLKFDQQQVLHVVGSAPVEWVRAAKQLSTQLYGITAWDDTQLVSTDVKTLEPFKVRFNPSYRAP